MKYKVIIIMYILFFFSFRDSISDYPLDLKESPDGFESVTSTYKHIREDEGRHIPHASGELLYFTVHYQRLMYFFKL